METIGQRIKAAREGAKISVVNFAAKCGVTRQTVYQWQNDDTTPTADNIITISDLTGWSIRRIMRGDLKLPDVMDSVSPGFIASTPEEQMLLSDFRDATPELRKRVRALLLQAESAPVVQQPTSSDAASAVQALAREAALNQGAEVLELDKKPRIKAATEHSRKMDADRKAKRAADERARKAKVDKEADSDGAGSEKE